MQEIIDNVEKAFSSFRTVDVLLIILFAAVFYYVFRVLKMNNVRSVIVVFALFIIVTGIIFASDVNLKGDVFMVIPLVLAGLILVIFNVEVKRDILNLNTLNRLSEKREHPVYATKDEVERYISEIIRALQNLSKDNIGALIILSNDNIPAQVLESGVILDANISSQLIEGIFFVKAPLHDGAMIINNYKIQAAGCFLPLTQNVNIPKELGTRHRAGIGITETSNVIALIVSEETGIITIAQKGKISRYADYDLLKKTLTEYYWKDLSGEGRKHI